MYRDIILLIYGYFVHKFIVDSDICKMCIKNNKYDLYLSLWGKWQRFMEFSRI